MWNRLKNSLLSVSSNQVEQSLQNWISVLFLYSYRCCQVQIAIFYIIWLFLQQKIQIVFLLQPFCSTVSPFKLSPNNLEIKLHLDCKKLILFTTFCHDLRGSLMHSDVIKFAENLSTIFFKTSDKIKVLFISQNFAIIWLSGKCVY